MTETDFPISEKGLTAARNAYIEWHLGELTIDQAMTNAIQAFLTAEGFKIEHADPGMNSVSVHPVRRLVGQWEADAIKVGLSDADD